MGMRLPIALMAVAAVAWGADPFVATWKLRKPDPPLESSTLQIVDTGLRHRLTYRMTYARSSNIMPVTEMFLTALDGKDSVALLGNGEAAPVKMAISKIDDRHWRAVVKTNGTVTSTSKVEVSADGKVMKIDTEAHTPGGKTVPGTQYWDRQ